MKYDISQAVGILACLGMCAVSLGCQDPVSNTLTLATDEHGVRDMAAADGYLYWATELSGQLKRIPIEGGSVELIVSDSQQLPNHLSVDASHVYWTTGDNNVMRVLRDGSDAPELIVNTAANLTGLAVDSVYVYWTSEDVDVSSGTRSVKRIAKQDIVPLAAPDEPPGSETLFAGLLNPSDLVAAGGLYCLDGSSSANDGRLLEILSPQSSPNILASALVTPTSLAANAGNVYWGSVLDETVSWTEIGGSSVTTVAGGHGVVLDIAGDANNVYWTSDEGTLSMASLDGAIPQDLVIGPEGTVRLALDETSLYWVNSSTNAIRTKYKPVPLPQE